MTNTDILGYHQYENILKHQMVVFIFSVSQSLLSKYSHHISRSEVLPVGCIRTTIISSLKKRIKHEKCVIFQVSKKDQI